MASFNGWPSSGGELAETERAWRRIRQMDPETAMRLKCMMYGCNLEQY